MADMNKVLCNAQQDLSEQQKRQARQNIGVDLELHESILDYADDWVDISNEFSLFSGVTVYTGPLTQGTVADLKILFSKKLKILYFSNSDCRLVTTSALDFNWRQLLRYNGNRFLTAETGGSNPYPTDYSYPIDVTKGPLLVLCCLDFGSTSEYCMQRWVGTNSSDCGLGAKLILNNGQNSTGVYCSKMAFVVEVPADNA